MAETANTNGHQQHRQQPPAPQRWVPPHDAEAEAGVLGGVMLHNDWLAQLEQLRTDDFYVPKHRVVWEAIRNLQHAGRPIDVITLDYEIECAGKGDVVGAADLGAIALRVPVLDNVLQYAEIIRRDSRNRSAVVGLSSIAERAKSWQHDPSELISEMVGELKRLEEMSQAPAKRLKLLGVAQAVEDLAQLAAAPVFPTPFPALNDAIGFGGFKGTQVYTVAAGTGRGKTTFVSHLGAHSAEHGPVLVVSYEMKPGYFIARKAAGVIGCHSNDIISGAIPLGDVMRAMPYPRMFLMHKPTLAEIREAVMFLKEKFGKPPLVIIDYIQKLADEIAAGQQRPDLRMATSIASATLCDIAEKSEAAIVAVSAIGRGKGKILSNPRKMAPYELVEVAKESGAVEYDGAALIVLSLHSEYEDEARTVRVATITLAKTRFGTECHIDSRYQGARGMWWSLDRCDFAPPVMAPAATGISAVDPGDDTTARVLAVLGQKGWSPSRDALYKAVGGNKKMVSRAIKQLIDAGLIVKNPAFPGQGLTVASTAEMVAVQTTIEGA